MNKRYWDHSGKPSVFVEVKEGKEVYRGPFKGAKADKHAELKAEIENLRKERDEAREALAEAWRFADLWLAVADQYLKQINEWIRKN